MATASSPFRLSQGSSGRLWSMPIDVETRDATALTDADLDEMAALGGAFDIGLVSKAKEDWVLCTTARDADGLQGVMFATLERIGGTPCVLIGLLSTRRGPQASDALDGLMGEAYHRALMAFPDEDVVVGTRMVRADAWVAFEDLSELIPRPGHRAVGEERAWGRRLAKRFAVDAHYDEQSFVVTEAGQAGFLDYVASGATGDKKIATLFDAVPADVGGALIVHGWSMAEDLVELGRR